MVLALRIIAADDVADDRLATVANLILTVSWGVMQRRVLWPGQVDRAVFAPLLACIESQIDALCGDGQATHAPCTDAVA